MSAVASPAERFADWRSVPLLSGLSTADWQSLSQAARLVEYVAGEVVIEEGGQSQNLWVVVSGSCQVVQRAPRGGEVLLAELGPYQQFGEMSFFHPRPHSASVRAKGPVQVLQIARGDFDVLVSDGCCGAYRLAVNVVSSLAERLRRMDDWVSQLVSDQPGPAAATAPPRADEWARFRDQLLSTPNL